MDWLTGENRELLEKRLQCHRQNWEGPGEVFPFIHPCEVRVLLVADGRLGFLPSMNWGLSTFVFTLLSMPGSYVRFKITLAHLDQNDESLLLPKEPRIVRRIPKFAFDDASHFGADMYDQVWLFGETSGGALRDGELNALADFMQQGGGLFATGDHGSIGARLGGGIVRVRSMRAWTSRMAEVSAMTGDLRNDTNEQGDEFDDQSDDRPQRIEPKLYTRWAGLWRSQYPHPVLCGSRGAIRVLPDHPHEGECEVRDNATDFPDGTAGNPRPIAEIIATSSVAAGRTATGKALTTAHGFGAIAAYDGHLASVGRVVTDATWHHFVNVNLVGDLDAKPDDNPKRCGFLASSSGQAHLEQIRTYHRNIAVWLARPYQQKRMWQALLWWLVFDSRVMEAVTLNPDSDVETADLTTLWEIGKHARSVLEKYAGKCRARMVALDLAGPFISPELRAKLDPWWPVPPAAPLDTLPWFCAEPLLDVALGGAVVALRKRFHSPSRNCFKNAILGDFQDVIASGVGPVIGSVTEPLKAEGRKFEALFS